MAKAKSARRWIVRGRVQGVYFRAFTQKEAEALGLAGYARNLEDGSVEVYAVGPQEKLEQLAARLYVGPRLSDVRGVEEQVAEAETGFGFHIR